MKIPREISDAQVIFYIYFENTVIQQIWSLKCVKSNEKGF